jgi:hypothetical protein
MMWALASTIGVALALGLIVWRDPTFWDDCEPYTKLDEYGERKRWKSSIRTPYNSWSSLAYWAAGSHIFIRAVTYDASSRRNCCTTQTHWGVALGVAFAWTGIASFLFHASLTERWRILDAGATMGAPVISTGCALYRALLASSATWAPQCDVPLLAACVAANIGCHFLARTRGWSDIVLPIVLGSHVALEWGPLRPSRTAADAHAWMCWAAIVSGGTLLRALDVLAHRRLPFVWLGHLCWHLLTSAAIVLLWTAAENVPDANEHYCVT